MTEPIEQAGEFAGVPDELQRLWTPHRMAYVSGADPDAGCPFCLAPQRTDEEGLVVHRGAAAFVVLNLFPYNPGHLLICPYRHVADLTDLTDDERTEVNDLTVVAMRVLRGTSRPAGFNLGMNQGEVAGAGVAAHLHQHVVPRWRGDANFLPIIGRTKAVPQLLDDTRRLLTRAWPSADTRGDHTTDDPSGADL